MSRTLVSILTPAYKAEPYIGQAIESVLAQTMPEWELIIVDDCSPDNTARVVEQYLGDPRIQFLRNERNLGAGGSRNRALEVAQGEWITLLDADDWYEPQRLERLLRFATETGEKYVVDLRRYVFEGSSQTKIARLSPVYPNPSKPVRYDVYRAVYGHIVEQPLFLHELVRKESLRYANLPKGEDYFFQFRVLYRAGSLSVLPEPLYNYRIHPDSTTRRYSGDLSKTAQFYEAILSLPEVQQDARLRRMVLKDYRRELGLQRVGRFHEAIKHLNWREARQIYAEAPGVIDLYPNFLKQLLLRKLGLLRNA